VRVGNWLTADQGRRLLNTPTLDTLREQRNQAMLAMLIGCGLRRGELLALTMEAIQQREERWVIADVNGKAGHIRTVPVPSWVKATVDRWTSSAGIADGRVFRAINKMGKVWGDGMTPKVIWDVVRDGRARVSAISPVANWIRSSFSWDTCRFKRRSGTSGASRNCAAPSTTRWALNPDAPGDPRVGGRVD